MTEIGMALSNPLKGERRPGHVGMPLPDVKVNNPVEITFPSRSTFTLDPLIYQKSD
jgi:hypothetical protein